jgi:diguanylate cyclase (GGDEF)-like protein
MLEIQRRQSDEMAVRLEDLNEQLRETAFRDALTGLYNRRFLVEFLAGKRALSIRMAIPLAVVLIDLDHFKRINDSLGHAVGDVVLREFARALAEGIRESDLAARYGGEEFVLILPQATARDAARVTVKILDRVRRTSFAGVPWSVTFSAGVAVLEEGEPLETLLERADKRLYEAKKKRNMVVSW